jgi:hypothetical protein
MSFQSEFPDFAPATMPAIPAGWADESWHNDTCPRFLTGNGFTVFVDYADEALREFDGGARFAVQPEASCENLLETDDWDAVLAFVAAGVVPALAQRFAEDLRANLTTAEFAEMQRRNAEYGPGICASHDFLDANILMHDAFTAVVGREHDMDSDADNAIWNAAWEIAKPRYLTKADA